MWVCAIFSTAITILSYTSTFLVFIAAEDIFLFPEKINKNLAREGRLLKSP